MRKYGKIDNNQTEIVNGLRKLGFSVESTASIGGGFPDIVVGYQGKNYLFEVKQKRSITNENPKPLTEHEKQFYESWRGQYAVVTCVEDVLSVVNYVNKYTCSTCGSTNTYITDAYHCNRCAVTTAI